MNEFSVPALGGGVVNFAQLLYSCKDRPIKPLPLSTIGKKISIRVPRSILTRISELQLISGHNRNQVIVELLMDSLAKTV